MKHHRLQVCSNLADLRTSVNTGQDLQIALLSACRHPTSDDGCWQPPAITTTQPAEQLSKTQPPVLLLNLPATEWLAVEIARCARTRPALAVVDHFYHAELLSRTAMLYDTSISVLLSINVGNSHAGIRPGYDAQRLARGISDLPGLLTTGLICDISGITQIRDIEDLNAVEFSDDSRRQPVPTSQPAWREAVSALQHTSKLLQQDGTVCHLRLATDFTRSQFDLDFPPQTAAAETAAIISNTAADWLTDLVQLPAELPLLTRDSIGHDQRFQHTTQAAQTWTSHIISRPSLGYAVADGGWLTDSATGAWMADSATEAWLAGSASGGWMADAGIEVDRDVLYPTGAVVRDVGPYTTLLELHGDALDLRIGDALQLQRKTRLQGPPNSQILPVDR